MDRSILASSGGSGQDDGGPRRQSRFHGRIEGTGRCCDWQGCAGDGEFRAPPDEEARRGARFDGPGRYRWFCLDHIREFNQRYNFFSGMSAEEIYEAQHPAAGWDRETRAFAAGAGQTPRWSDFADPIDALGARFKQNVRDRAAQAQSAQGPGQRLAAADHNALKTLGLGRDATRASIRQAYSRLVRAYHPDRNGGERAHEKALQEVIAAYTHLRKLAAFT